MAVSRELKAARRAMHVCTECGGPLDDPASKFRCFACRQPPEQRKVLLAERAEEERVTLKRERCKACVWSTWTGLSYHCPFPVGSCIELKKHTEGGEKDGA